MLMHHFHQAQTVGRSPALMVLLPPVQSNAADLEREGFVAAVRERSLPLDLLLGIPHASVERIAGDHPWPVWRTLWQRYLDSHVHQENRVRDSI